VTVRAVLDRIDELLTGADPATKRPLTIPMVKADNDIDRVEQTHPVDTFTYFLRSGGDPNAYKSFITAPKGIRSVSIILEIAAFHGSDEATTADRQELERQMADYWDEIVQVIQDPNNHDRGNTGWCAADDFQTSECRRAGNRLILNGRFVCLYMIDYPEL
jgi:hypothetical protein